MSTLCFQLSRDVAENLAYGQQQQQQQQQHNYYNTGTVITQPSIFFKLDKKNKFTNCSQ